MLSHAGEIWTTLVTCYLRVGTAGWAALGLMLTGIALGFRLITCRRDLRRARQDIKQMASQLQEAAARQAGAERANAAKGDFLACMSTELQAPMTGILNFAQMALKTDLPPLPRSYLERVIDSASWLAKVLSDVLDFSRLESGVLQLEESDFSFSACVLSAVKAVEPNAAKKHLELHSKVDPTVPPLLRGDPGRIRQVIVNLLENAVRFTTSGSVVLSASLLERTGDTTAVAISIADTGIGIPPDEQALVFEPFRGGKNVTLDQAGGTGLELSICKQLVELMAGSMEVQTHVGAGSTFRFTVRLRNAILMLVDEYDGEILSKLSARRMSVLIADENAACRRLVAKVFESAGHQVLQTVTAKQALDAFCTDLYDLVLVSPLLPDRTAAELVHDLRYLEPEASRTLIYCLQPESSDAPLPPAKVVDGFIGKPPEIDELLPLLNRTAAARTPPKSGSSDERDLTSHQSCKQLQI